MKYNERTREIIEDNRITQQTVADLLHIVQRTYADYESEKTRTFQPICFERWF